MNMLLRRIQTESPYLNASLQTFSWLNKMLAIRAGERKATLIHSVISGHHKQAPNDRNVAGGVSALFCICRTINIIESKLILFSAGRFVPETQQSDRGRCAFREPPLLFKRNVLRKETGLIRGRFSRKVYHPGAWINPFVLFDAF